jgi:hypothetical protein
MSLSSILDRPSASIHNPFRTYSNFVYPRTVDEMFTWALWFWDRNARYRTSVQKVVSYFVTDVTVTQKKNSGEIDADAVESFKELLVDNYDMLGLTMQFGTELAALGNSFISCERIFTRELLCPNKDCGWQMRLKALRKNRDYEWDGKHFKGKCPQCGKRVTYNIKDVPSTDTDGKKLRFVSRDAVDMAVQYNQLTGTYKYFYRMPSHIKSAITRGDSVYLEDAPRVFLEAASTDSYIEFPADNFFSARTFTLSALDKMYKGWGVPIFMSSFDSFLRLQHLDKFNEAVTMDYIAPTRLISPQPANLKAGIDDPNRSPMSGSMFAAFMQESLKKVKENPTTWIVSPVPVQYQMLGGEAKQMTPVDLMEWESVNAIANMGIPQELRQTNFQVVAHSMALRMFERQWYPFAKDMSRFTRWAANRIADAHSIEDMDVSLDVTSFVEDDTNKQVLLSLMQGGMIAKTNVLKRFGIDFEDDIKLRMQEQKKEQEAAMDMQVEQQGQEMVGSVMPPPGNLGIAAATANMQQPQDPAMAGQPAGAAAPAGPMPGGAPMPFNTGASQSASIEQMYQEAQQMAQQLYSVPQNVRTRELTNLKATNPTMHAMVKQFITDMKQQVASDAVAQSQQGG